MSWFFWSDNLQYIKNVDYGRDHTYLDISWNTVETKRIYSNSYKLRIEYRKLQINQHKHTCNVYF